MKAQWRPGFGSHPSSQAIECEEICTVDISRPAPRYNCKMVSSHGCAKVELKYSTLYISVESHL